MIVGALAGVLARKLIKTAGIEWFNHFLGGIFGLLRGVLVDSILMMAMMAFAIKADAVRQSVLAPYLTTGTRVIALVMPENLKAQFRLGFEKFREAVIQNDKRATKN
jgi:uncharacterized membrane protein required for colicin V production